MLTSANYVIVRDTFFSWERTEDFDQITTGFVAAIATILGKINQQLALAPRPLHLQHRLLCNVDMTPAHN